MSFLNKVALLSAFAATTFAHGTVRSFLTDGTFNQGFLLDYYYAEQNGQTPPTHYGWYAENLDNGFVEPNSYSSPDIICHKNAKVDGAATAKVAAGGKVDFQWTTWPDSHVGPVITYVANCNGDCASVDKASLKFVKIDAAGYNTETKSWAATDMIKNNNTWSTTVPSNLAAGNYVFRHEIIALHSAGSENGAQNYPQCVNIEVTGSGTENPEGVLGTELYKSTDAGILVNVYGTITDYEIPGPALFGSGSTGGSTPTTPATPTNSTPAATSSAASTASPTVVAEEPSTTPSATPVASAPATPTPSSGAGADEGSDSLPETFTLETFISWLQKVGKPAAARRHARAFF